MLFYTMNTSPANPAPQPEGNPFGSPMYLMAKPAGAACNLRCRYCYYLEKGDPAARQLMDCATLELFIRQYIESQTVGEVMFTWHGGEAMLRPVSFYRRAIELQRKYAAGRTVLNCLQTNGTLITEEWARFLRSEGWLVGVSIDGPQEFHDEYRRAAGGKPTFSSVMRGIRLLHRPGQTIGQLCRITQICNRLLRQYVPQITQRRAA